MNYCTECDGMGLTVSSDWDDIGSYITEVLCECCEGVGELAECECCREPMPPPAYERGRGRCESCIRSIERDDRAAEEAALRRMS